MRYHSFLSLVYSLEIRYLFKRIFVQAFKQNLSIELVLIHSYVETKEFDITLITVNVLIYRDYNKRENFLKRKIIY
jgi:hypothetical protein